jgi:acylphosphatase
MLNPVALNAIVHGHVQGVYYRAFVREKAVELGLAGFARNLSSGRDVEVRVEGEKEQIEILVDYLKVGPSRAMVEEVTVTWSKYGGAYSSFTVL